MALSVARTIETEQLLEAGEARAIAKSMRNTQKRLLRAVAARDALRRRIERDPDSLRDDDGHKRD